MKAFKCDICDKLYTNPTEYEEKTDPVSGVSTGFIPTTLVFGNEDFAKTTIPHDVCPDCIKFMRKLFPTIRAKGGTDWVVWP